MIPREVDCAAPTRGGACSLHDGHLGPCLHVQASKEAETVALVDARNGTGKAAPCSDCGAEDPTIVNDVLAATGGDVSASPDSCSA